MHSTYWFAVADGAGAWLAAWLAAGVGVLVAVAVGVLAAAGGVEELPQAANSSPAVHVAMKIIPPIMCFFIGAFSTQMMQCVST
jgi:hypothetical protein